MPAYATRTVGQPGTPDYRVFLEADGRLVSPFHDVPLWADRAKGLVNMVCEIPRWSNAKLEIATGEPLNPIKQDVKKGALRYVRNLYPFHGYPWNYGALPQTWEDPTVPCPWTNFHGDKDPIDVLDIGDRVAYIGQIKTVKVLGVIALVDEGETDWKIIAIDVTDPLAAKLHDIGDVQRELPGLLDATRHWFRLYKVPDGKPENAFALQGAYKDRAFALEVIASTEEHWKALVSGRTKYDAIRCEHVLSAEGSCKAADDLVRAVPKGVVLPAAEQEAALPDREVTKSYYGIFPAAL